MSCSIITIVTSRGIEVQQLPHVAALVDRKPGERLVEQQHLWILRQCHGDLDPALFAVGGFGQRPVGDVIETDALERGARLLDQVLLAMQRRARVPAQRRQPEQRQRRIAQDGVAR